jgi:ABC-2 type transport system ATP-binding protein
MDDSVAVAADGLTKRFGDTAAVDDLDLEIPLGQTYGFLGPNGAGKTTTMRMLTTLTKPTSGEARIMGESVADRDAVAGHIGYLPEDPPLYPELTGREQLEYVAALRDVPDDVAEERIELLVDLVEMGDAIDDRIGTYSKGMKNKTAIVQTVLHVPDVVFLDEPTAGLDPRAARTVRELIDEMGDEQTTIFLSTHVLPVAEQVADVVGVLDQGRLVAEGPPAKLKYRAEEGERSLEQVFMEVTTERTGESA